MNITLDGQTTQFDRRACPDNDGSSVCEYPWFTAHDLSNTNHTLSVELVGPPIAKAPAGHLIADLRYIMYVFFGGYRLSPADILIVSFPWSAIATLRLMQAPQAPRP